MPGYFLKSPSRRPPRQRAWQFALLEEEDDESSWCENDNMTKKDAGISQADDTAKKQDNAAVPSPSRDELLFPDEQEFFCKDENDRHEKSAGGVGNSSSCDETAESSNNSDDETGSQTAAAAPPIKKGSSIAKKRRPSYPMLAPLTPSTESTSASSDSNVGIADTPDSHDENDHQDEFELFSLQVEMAKSAFLKDPCQTRWMDLVHSFRMQKMRRQQTMNANDDGFVDNRIAEKQIEGNENWCSEGAANVEIGPALAHLEESIASLEEKAILRAFHHEQNDDGLYFGDDCADNWEKAMHAFHDQDHLRSGYGDYANDNNNDDGDDESSEEWSEERDVSPLSFSSSFLANEEEHEEMTMPSSPPVGGEYGPDCVGADEEKETAIPPVDYDNIDDADADEEKLIASNATELTRTNTAGTVTTTTTIAAKSKSKPLKPQVMDRNRAHVQKEVLHWEKRIVRYDQRYVNIVAAALDECAQEKWKIGRIVEAVVPSSSSRGCGNDDGTPSSSMEDDDGDDFNEEILYVV